MAAPQAFYTYQQLSKMWQVQHSTVRAWVGDLKRENPAAVWISYRLWRGHRRVAYLAADTVRLLQSRHFPRGEQPKNRGTGLEGRDLRSSRYLRRLMAAQAAERRPASIAPTAPPVRRLSLPPIPSRDDRGAAGRLA